MIKVKGLVKKYKSGAAELLVLNGLDLEVKKGEFIAITGRSGSGKSTLLYQLGLLDHPNSGEIIINGTDVMKLDKDERSNFRLNELGYVFQDYALIPELTALENIAIPLLMQGKSMDQIKKIAAEMLDRIGLGDRLNNLPSQLSGGEQQRVSIARAISHNPKVLFADEPTANLDNETADAVLETFLSLHREGQTIVMVTHEPEYAALTERIVLLDGGIIKNDKINK
jgi:putative ABC transport system ATP-binding protein